MQFDDWPTDGFITTQSGMARRAVHQVDGVLVIVDARVFVTAGEAEFQARQRLPCRFEFRAPDRGVEIHVDRSAVHDLRNLIALVIVVEDIGVEGQRAVAASRVLRSEFDRR